MIMWQSENKIYTIHKNDFDHVSVQNTRDYFVDYPILYSRSDKIAYNYPYRWPAYVKDAVRKIMFTMPEGDKQ